MMRPLALMRAALLDQQAKGRLSVAERRVAQSLACTVAGTLLSVRRRELGEFIAIKLVRVVAEIARKQPSLQSSLGVKGD